MKQIQQEEIFAWFQSLSGAKRIELMCGLISMCIPLEVRFFETIIQDSVKRDFNSFRDAEIKANSYQELNIVCKCDLLLEKTSTENYYDETTEMTCNGGSVVGNSIILNNANPNSNNNNNNGNNSLASPINSVLNTANTNNDNNVNGTKISKSLSSANKNDSSIASGGQVSNMISNFPSRSKLIISLCLMQPSNNQCSTLIFNSIRKQLMPEIIYQAICQVFIPKNQNIDQLFSELLLLLTMAMYHPAFNYEQRDLLASQKKEIEQLYFEIISYVRSQQLIAAAAQVQVPVIATPSNQIVTVQTSGAVPATTISTTSNSGQSLYHQSSHQPSNKQQMNPQQQASQLAQQQQSHHTQPTHQFHHPPYHQSTGNKSLHSNPGPHLGPSPAVASTGFTLPYLPTPIQMANIGYTTPSGPNLANQTNAVIQNLTLLQLNSPSQQASVKSPAPSLSPSGVSNKMPVVTSSGPTNLGQFSIKLDPMYTATGTTAVAAIPNANSLIPLMENTINNPAGIRIPLIDDSKSIVSSNSSNASSDSCYNCGNLGHRGTECTSAASSGDDNH
ncbi:hypothetical protein QR98_0010770 [Sarcoptes scabiei]|uniref:Uncharacterized protein n=1 Tax=Sarcoptes scabiei TaxID=52283 RepID=A0A131ZVK8_SARSC|nr:hypothetical protein QR98_0010770 [Sarcoptes scabiei]